MFRKSSKSKQKPTKADELVTEGNNLVAKLEKENIVDKEARILRYEEKLFAHLLVHESKENSSYRKNAHSICEILENLHPNNQYSKAAKRILKRLATPPYCCIRSIYDLINNYDPKDSKDHEKIVLLILLAEVIKKNRMISKEDGKCLRTMKKKSSQDENLKKKKAGKKRTLKNSGNQEVNEKKSKTDIDHLLEKVFKKENEDIREFKIIFLRIRIPIKLIRKMCYRIKKFFLRFKYNVNKGDILDQIWKEKHPGYKKQCYSNPKKDFLKINGSWFKEGNMFSEKLKDEISYAPEDSSVYINFYNSLSGESVKDKIKVHPGFPSFLKLHLSVPDENLPCAYKLILSFVKPLMKKKVLDVWKVSNSEYLKDCKKKEQEHFINQRQFTFGFYNNGTLYDDEKTSLLIEFICSIENVLKELKVEYKNPPEFREEAEIKLNSCTFFTARARYYMPNDNILKDIFMPSGRIVDSTNSINNIQQANSTPLVRSKIEELNKKLAERMQIYTPS